MKKILSLFLASVFSIQMMSVASAASPKSTFNMDCNTLEKQVSIGYQSDPANPANGPEIIALKFTYRLSPHGTSTFDDIKDVNLTVNPAFGSFIVAENNKTVVGSTVEIKFAGGFTGGNGAAQATDLIFVKGISQKEFQISVLSGELYPKNSTENIYQNSNEAYVANPISCGGNQNNSNTTSQHLIDITDFAFTPKTLTIKKGDTVKWTNKGQAPHTVTTTGGTDTFDSASISPNATYSHTFNTLGVITYRCELHPTMTASITVTDSESTTTTNTPPAATTTTDETTIALSSDKASAKSGDVVKVTALIKNRKGASINWSQTGGAQIVPDIQNQELPENETQSVLSFTMVESAQNIVLKLAIGNVTESITIATESTSQATANSAEVGEDGLTLQERLQQRREELNAQTTPTTTSPITSTPGNVHAAAGGLSQSGPAETSLIIIASGLMLLAWKRLRRSEFNI